MPNCYVIVTTNPESPRVVAEKVRSALHDEAELIGEHVFADLLTNRVYVYVQVPDDVPLDEAFDRLRGGRAAGEVPVILAYGLLDLS